MAEPQQKRAKHESAAADESGLDRISNLPYPILHLIFSFLPPINVIRTCALSKTFLSVFTSFPVVHLEFHEFKRSSRVRVPREKKMTEFVEYVDYSVDRLKLDTDLQKFRFQARLMERKQAHRIKKHINFAIENGVGELGVDLVCPRYSLPRTITSANSIITLDLAGVKLFNLSEMDLNCWWPKLENLSITRCTGLRKFDVSSTRIRSIALESCIGLKNIKIESSSLENFVFSGTSSNACEIDISGCKFIKVLSLGCASIGDNWMEINLPKFPNLEGLKLNKLSTKSRKLKVSSEKLKRLKVVKRHGRIDVQAPNLESLKYSGSRKDIVNIDAMPLKALSWECNNIKESFFKKQISNISNICGLRSLELEFNLLSSLARFEINHHKAPKSIPKVDRMVTLIFRFQGIHSLKSGRNLLPTDLVSPEHVLHVMVSFGSSRTIRNQDFVELWNWIASFGRVKVLTFVCFSVEDLVYPEKEIVQLLKPVYELKHITVKLLIRRSISPELVNSFLWQSPNLETLNFFQPGGVKRSIKFEYGSRSGFKDHLLCCRPLSVKCWRHSMTKVVLKNFDSGEKRDLLHCFMSKSMQLSSNRW